MEQIKYPASCALLEEDELVYLAGGADADKLLEKIVNLFYKAIGKELQKNFLKSFDTMVWDCLNEESPQPLLNWCDEFWKMSLPRKAVFLYSGYYVVKTTVEYWQKT